jgi:hypothetical protein
VVPSEAAEGLVTWCGWHGMQEVTALEATLACCCQPPRGLASIGVSCRFFEAQCDGGPFRYWKVIDRAARYHLTDVGIDPPGWDPATLVVPVVARAASVEVPVPATVVGARAASGRLTSLGINRPAAASGAI